ncbi:MAG: M28 family peptidase [candidate division WOR-3 bacterium]|nr:MAG: M28 family peptidase [candidate division WOR-3 bacterium]
MLRFVTFVLVFSSLASAGLGVVEVPPARRAEAEARGLLTLADQGDMLFVLLDENDAAALRAEGWSAQVLDPEFAPGTYFMVPHTKLNPPGAPGRILWDDERRAIVRLGEREAFAAQDEGWLLVPLPRKPRLLQPDADAGFDWAPDSAVRRMADMVSLDTLMSDIRRLQDYVTRYSYSPKCESVALWLAGEFAGLGWDVALDTYFLRQPTTRALNVEATWPGIAEPDSIVICCAHFDSYSRSGMTNAPGADDNATGTAILLELARVLATSRFRWTVKLLAFSGEEQWMKGSYHWVDSVAIPQGLDIYGAFNVDMIGYTAYDTNHLVVNRDVASQPMALLAESTNMWYDIGLSILNYLDPDCAGDNTPFWEVGIMSTFALEDSEWGIWNGSNPNYHTIYDTVGTLRPGQVHRVGKLTAACVATVAGPDGPTGVVEPASAVPVTGNTSGTLLFSRVIALPGLWEVYDITGTRVASGRETGFGAAMAPGIYYFVPTDRSSGPRRVLKVE